MSPILAGKPVKSVQVEATVIRKDGTRVPLGVIGYWHRNPFMRLYFRIRSFFKGA